MKKKKNSNILYYLALLVSIIFLIKNISELDFENLSNSPFSGILSYTFFILIFIRLIIKKNEKLNYRSNSD